MKWRLHDNVREYVYEHLVVKEDKHYKELSEELGMSDAVLRELKMEERSIRDGTLVIHRGESEVRLVTVEELLNKSFNYALEVDRRKKASSLANYKRIEENKRREKLGMSFKIVGEVEEVKKDVSKIGFNKTLIKEKDLNKGEEEKVVLDVKAEGYDSIVNASEVLEQLVDIPIEKVEVFDVGVQMAHLYTEEYWTLSQLQEKFGYGVSKVRDILVAQGVQIRPRAVLLSKDKKDELLAHLERESDKPIEYFVKLYKLSEATIKSYQVNMRGERNKVGLKSKNAFKKMCKLLRSNPTLSFEEAAIQEGISFQVISRISDLLVAEGFEPNGKQVKVEGELKASAGLETVLNTPNDLDNPFEVFETINESQEDWRKRALDAEQEVQELKLKIRKLIQAHAEFVSVTLV